MEDIVVRGVTLKKDLARVVLMGVPNRPGIASQIFARIAQHQVVVDDIIQNIVEHASEANIGFTTSGTDAKEAEVIAQQLCKDLTIKKFEVESRLAKVSIVGVGMKTHTGVAARMFSALAEAQVNIQNITTSEIVISCIVDEKDGERAVQTLHAAFGLDKAEE
jgi:aspartate kinase